MLRWGSASCAGGAGARDACAESFSIALGFSKTIMVYMSLLCGKELLSLWSVRQPCKQPNSDSLAVRPLLKGGAWMKALRICPLHEEWFCNTT
eukprot:1882118-Amphidinium_carterae.1